MTFNKGLRNSTCRAETYLLIYLFIILFLSNLYMISAERKENALYTWAFVVSFCHAEIPVASTKQS